MASYKNLCGYLSNAPEDQLIREIQFDFDSVNALLGYLETHLTNKDFPAEMLINTYDLKLAGFELEDTLELRKEAIKQLKNKFCN